MRTRKPLAELVSTGRLEVGTGCLDDGEHAGPVGDLIAYCDRGGHAIIGERLPGIHNWRKEKMCLAHWRDLCELLVSNTDKLFDCKECGVPRGLTLYAVWPSGFVTALSNHYYPFENRKAAR
jgi:hypothetical protein